MNPHPDLAARTTGLTVLHATSLAPVDECAFRHAVALARSSASRLVSVHADGGDEALARIPRAVDHLVRWSALPADAREGDEHSLGMSHLRIAHDCCAGEPVDTLLDATRDLRLDLVVATTGSHRGVFRVLYGSVAEALAQAVRVPTLFFPEDCRPFVAADTGACSLGRIVVAAGDEEATGLGLRGAAWMADLFGARTLDVDLVHAGQGKGASHPSAVVRPGTSYRLREIEGSIEDAILDDAEDARADLIVMATRGHDSVGDFVLGSHTERVVRRARCPLLSIPLR